MNSFTLPPCQRLLLLGGGSLLVRLTQWAAGQDHQVQVVTSPRHAVEPVGADGKPFTACLKKGGIPFIVTDSIDSDEVRGIVGDPAETFCLSIAAPWIFSDDSLRELFQGRLLNLHGTRLPQYRGGGGFSWQIMNGNRLGFCVLHKIEADIDTGDLLSVREFLYPSACRIPLDYMRVYEEENFAFLIGILAQAFREGIDFSSMTQPEYLSTYWPRLHTPTHGWVDWSLNTDQIERFVCAFDEPYDGAQTLWNGRPVHLRGALADFNDGYFHPFQAGLVYRNNGRWLHAATRGGSLILESVTDPDGRNLLDEIRPGDRLHTPREKLEAAMERVVYTPLGLK